MWLSQAGNSRTHFKTHSGEKPNKCSQCEFASSLSDDLRRHLKTYRGEMPNKCNQFNYASSESSHLRRHLKTHSGENPNKCNQCNYASSEASHLRRHLKTHSWEKSNRCNLRRHLTTQTKIIAPSVFRIHLRTVIWDTTRVPHWGKALHTRCSTVVRNILNVVRVILCHLWPVIWRSTCLYTQERNPWSVSHVITVTLKFFSK